MQLHKGCPSHHSGPLVAPHRVLTLACQLLQLCLGLAGLDIVVMPRKKCQEKMEEFHYFKTNATWKRELGCHNKENTCSFGYENIIE